MRAHKNSDFSYHCVNLTRNLCILKLPYFHAGSLGTGGRVCQSAGTGSDSCEKLCCGRSTILSMETVADPINCSCEHAFCNHPSCNNSKPIREPLHRCEYATRTQRLATIAKQKKQQRGRRRHKNSNKKRPKKKHDKGKLRVA